jgi:hypothetical protein
MNLPVFLAADLRCVFKHPVTGRDTEIQTLSAGVQIKHLRGPGITPDFPIGPDEPGAKWHFEASADNKHWYDYYSYTRPQVTDNPAIRETAN